MGRCRSLLVPLCFVLLASVGSPSRASEAAEVSVFFKAGAKPVIKFVSNAYSYDADLTIAGTYPNYEVTASNFGSRVVLKLEQIDVNLAPTVVVSNRGTDAIDVEYTVGRGTPLITTIGPGSALSAGDDDSSIIDVCLDFH